jgi:Ribonuclease 2-5A
MKLEDLAKKKNIMDGVQWSKSVDKSLISDAKVFKYYNYTSVKDLIRVIITYNNAIN